MDPLFKTIEENRVIIKTMSEVEKEEMQRLENWVQYEGKGSLKNLNSSEYKFQQTYMKKMNI